MIVFYYSTKFSCSIEGCTSTFSRKDSMRLHEAGHRQDAKPFVCKDCGASFTRKGTMNEHARRSHFLESKNWSCADCNKTFFCRQQLERHRRTHLDERPYVCSICGKAFTRYSVAITFFNNWIEIDWMCLQVTPFKKPSKSIASRDWVHN